MQNLEDKRHSSSPGTGHGESNISVLSADINYALNSELNYLKKKIENIGIALYLIADKIKDNIDVKVNVKHASSDLLVNASSLIRHNNPADSPKTESRASSAGLDACLKSILGSLSLALSHIKIGYLTQAISGMNFSLVQQQLVEIMGHVDQMVDSSGADQLKSQLKQVEFFSHAKWPSQARTPRNTSQANHKGQYIGHDVDMSYIDPQVTKKTPAPSVEAKQPDLKDRKENRKNAIIALLSRKSNLTVKDFLSVITDCSEKTIQRELIELVVQGVLKKEGERRWSRYSLPNTPTVKMSI
jgi:hypothetical protein